tara:strand:+ start:220 stop:1206 length:987 start_codon:yes stop_codon:yes gene_type:complete
MARITLGLGTSHTPMLNATAEDWFANFAALDRQRGHRDKAGRPLDYDDLLLQADPRARSCLDPAIMAARHSQAQAGLGRLADTLTGAGLDALIVIGDDQNELLHADNQPSMLIYWGDSIANTPRHRGRGLPPWYESAMGGYFDDPAREYPVDAELARHVIESLNAQEFDVAAANSVPGEHGEGHAYGFVHRRLMGGTVVPVVPVFLNTYFAPNQPSPARCYRLGQALRRAVEAFPGERRVGIVASGGLSHFTVDEELDATVIEALQARDAETLMALPPEKLEAGSSEIRNWICAAGALEGLELQWTDYIPGYRTEAGTGTGICFAVWT